MTTDRELLELAARASEVELWLDSVSGYRNGANGDTWNPLTDDGDALRLAVKLELEISASYDESAIAYVGYDDGDRIRYVIEPKGDDPYAATRRAIVRAAAEIGRKVP